jgi:predicted alpha/beta superfamily hydrolase
MNNKKTKQFLISVCTILVLGISAISGQNISNDSSKTITIHSAILDEDRVCFVSLPDSYNTNTTNEYPVLILLDGYTFFQSAIGVVHFMSSDRNRNYSMPETIIVAIENVDRERDFTHTKIKTKRANTMGGGKNFLNFIEKELIPYVDNNYRTKAHRTLVGHSLGGLFTLNALMDEHSIFDFYLSIDPSIWWDENLMKNKVDGISGNATAKKIFIASANQNENRYERNKKRHNSLYALLRAKLNNHNIAHKTYDNENHRSVPLVALYDGLKFLNKK